VKALVVVNGTATLTGATVESLTVIAGTAELDATTTVTGDVYHLNSTIETADGAEIGGDIRDVTTDVGAFAIFLGAAALVLWVGFALATVLAGLLVAGLAARQVRQATALISREPGMTFLTGLLAVVVPPILAVLAFATLIGIPAGLGLLFVLWPARHLAGRVAAQPQPPGERATRAAVPGCRGRAVRRVRDRPRAARDAGDLPVRAGCRGAGRVAHASAPHDAGDAGRRGPADGRGLSTGQPRWRPSSAAMALERPADRRRSGATPCAPPCSVRTTAWSRTSAS
jgi:hypothetical protein